MSRPRNTIPKFSVDRNGRTFTKVCGRFISLGRADDPQSQVRYAAVLTGQVGDAAADVAVLKPATSISELFLKYVIQEMP